MRDKVLEMIADQAGARVERIKDESNFEDDLGMDQLDMIELVVYLEEEFSFEITEDEQSKLFTVKDLVDLVETKTSEE